MHLQVRYNNTKLYNKVLTEHLDRLEIRYKLLNFGGIEIYERTSKEKIKQLKDQLSDYGIEFLSDNRSILVQKIKAAIIEIVNAEEDVPLEKFSVCLSKAVNHSYGYISNLFSETCYVTIENFIILQRIEKAKRLLLEENNNLTEISYKLNYSSVAHLSSQFKKVTGLTPTTFIRIVKKRQMEDA